MKLFRVIGNVTLSRCHPCYQGATLLATEPLGPVALGAEPAAESDMVVVWDDRGAGIGHQIAVSDGAEAAQAFRPELKAVDAYNSAILDSIYIDPNAIKQLKLS